MESVEFGNRVFEQMMEFWVSPELQKRIARNEWNRDVSKLWAAQVIFRIGAVPIVLLNSELKAQIKVRVNRPIQAGEDVYEGDIAEVVSVDVDLEDRDAGHMTAVFIGDKLLILFDATYNKEKSRSALQASREFLSAAGHSLSEQNTRALVENIFGAVELAARAELIVFADQKFIESKTHSSTRNKINQWAKLGNVDLDVANLLNEISELRYRARYDYSEFLLSDEKASALFERAVAVVDHISERRLSRSRKEIDSG